MTQPANNQTAANRPTRLTPIRLGAPPPLPKAPPQPRDKPRGDRDVFGNAPHRDRGGRQSAGHSPLAGLKPPSISRGPQWTRAQLEQVFDALWPRLHLAPLERRIQTVKSTEQETGNHFLSNYKTDALHRIHRRDREDFLRLSQNWVTPTGWTSLLSAAQVSAGQGAAQDLQNIRTQNPKTWPVMVYHLLRDVVSEEGRAAGEPVAGIDMRNIRTSSLGLELRTRGVLSRTLWNDAQYRRIRTVPARSLRLTREDPVRAFVLRAKAWLTTD